MQHIVKKQIINLSIDKKLDAFHIQQLVSNHYHNKIVPVLQQAFDAASNEEETISLDTLQIDLGIINEKEIEKGTWEELVLKKITEQLIPIKYGVSSKAKVTKQPKSLSISGQWIFYMQHGYLPWNVLQINQDWYDKVLEAFAIDSSAINHLRNLIKNFPQSVNRIITQHPENFLQSLTETLTSESQDALIQVINQLGAILSSQRKKDVAGIIQKKELKQKLWKQALQLAATGDKNLKPEKIALQLLRKNFSIQQLATKKVRDFVLKNKIEIPFLEQIKKEKEHEETKKPMEDISTEVKNNRNEIDEDGIYVTSAGVVLLHPFLTHFFKNLQLVNAESFVDALARNKALYLIHYLSTGNTKPEEHELVMAKVLCVFPLEEPVSDLIELTKEELQEADSLLASAIAQWEVLKSTSPAGLREGFLQRNGKLFTKNGQLILQVEASSIDVLLDQLPWNLSMVKLPWMEDILKVEWR